MLVISVNRSFNLTVVTVYSREEVGNSRNSSAPDFLHVFRASHHSDDWEDSEPGGPFSAPRSNGVNNPFRVARQDVWRRWCRAIFALCSAQCVGEEGTTLANVRYGDCAVCSRALYENADDFSSVANINHRTSKHEVPHCRTKFLCGPAFMSLLTAYLVVQGEHSCRFLKKDSDMKSVAKLLHQAGMCETKGSLVTVCSTACNEKTGNKAPGEAM